MLTLRYGKKEKDGEENVLKLSCVIEYYNGMGEYQQKSTISLKTNDIFYKVLL